VSAWVEDPAEPSGWRWDPDAPTADPTAAQTLPTVDDLAGNLGTVTDDEWRDAHERLIADMPRLGHELAYVWNPQLAPRNLVRPGEQDMAPGPYRYDPNLDERFHGGGFRG
jgi:hypothetical protein